MVMACRHICGIMQGAVLVKVSLFMAVGMLLNPEYIILLLCRVAVSEAVPKAVAMVAADIQVVLENKI